MPITTIVVSSNLMHGEVYPIQDYVIKFVSDLRQVGGFFPGTLVSTTNKTDRHDVTEIFLKVALNTINQPANQMFAFTESFEKTKTSEEYVFTITNLLISNYWHTLQYANVIIFPIVFCCPFPSTNTEIN